MKIEKFIKILTIYKGKNPNIPLVIVCITVLISVTLLLGLFTASAETTTACCGSPSLVFTKASSTCSQITATICNQGTADMFDNDWIKIYYKADSDPIDNENYEASLKKILLKVNECEDLSYSPLKNGFYRFNVYDLNIWSAKLAFPNISTEICGDDIDQDCDGRDLQCPSEKTITAYKVVCNSESDLPNWGNNGQALITSTTASNFISNNQNCHLQSDWYFQYSENSTTNPGDNIEIATSSGWNTVGPTGAGGSVSFSTDSTNISMREVLKDGYIGFTGENIDQNISAELYCYNEVYQYDNWELLNELETGRQYYCVAFNALKPTACGNQIIEGNEQCDDGNTNSGDGCSSSCAIEGSLTICKYNDLNKNGEVDEGTDIPLVWNMNVTMPNQSTTTVSTSERTGCVTLSLLPTGNYMITEEVKNGWIIIYPAEGNSLPAVINADNKNPIINFLNYSKGVISGCKYSDIDNDGEIDDTESKLSGWEINLQSCVISVNGTSSEQCILVATTTTGSNGCYEFDNLDDGLYKISETNQDGWTQTYPVNPAYHSIEISSTSISIAGKNFANYKPGETPAPYCGDGIMNQSSEQCDKGSGNGTCPATCSTECQMNQCGGGSSSGGGGGGGGTPLCILLGNCGGATGYASQNTPAITETAIPLVLGEEGAPILKITKTVSVKNISPGQKNIEYIITVKNEGNLTAFSTVVKDNLPTGLMYDEYEESSHSWAIGDLAAGKSYTIKYRVSADDNIKAGSYINIAEARADNANDRVTAMSEVKVEREIVVLAETGFRKIELFLLLSLIVGLIAVNYNLRKLI